MPSDAPKTSGVYTIYSSVNGRSYIGSAVNFRKRWYRHQSDLRKGKHHSRHLQRAWDKYGPDAFEFSVLEECPIDQLLVREQYHLDLTIDRYNCAPVAGSCLGVKHSDETRAKTSIASTGRKHTPETKAKIGAATAGHEVSSEARERISAAQKGRKATPEAKANMSRAMMGNTNSATAFLGRKHTPETIERMRVAALARESRKRAEKDNEACLSGVG